MRSNSSTGNCNELALASNLLRLTLKVTFMAYFVGDTMTKFFMVAILLVTSAQAFAQPSDCEAVAKKMNSAIQVVNGQDQSTIATTSFSSNFKTQYGITIDTYEFHNLTEDGYVKVMIEIADLSGQTPSCVVRSIKYGNW